MKKLLLCMTLILSMTTFANDVQQCSDVGDISGSYSTVYDADTSLSSYDSVDTRLTQISPMIYKQEQIIDGEHEVFTVRLKDTNRGCEIAGEGFIVEKLADGKIFFLSDSIMYFLLKH